MMTMMTILKLLFLLFRSLLLLPIPAVLLLLLIPSNVIIFPSTTNVACLAPKKLSTRASNNRELASATLPLLTYETIHKLAVRDQVRAHVPAQKSLQTRQTISLNGLWDFCLDEKEEGFLDHWHSFSLREKCNKENFYRMPVPSAFNELPSDKRVQNYVGWLWYQTRIPPLPSSSISQQQPIATDNRLLELVDWYLQFESVDYLALVWISPILAAQNETSSSSSSKQQQPEDEQESGDAIFLGSHVGGHLPFVLNLTKTNANWLLSNSSHWLAGQSSRLTVAVSNRLTRDTIPSGRMLNLSEQVGRDYKKFQPDFDFFHFAGIMGNVNLFALKSCHFTNIETLTSAKIGNANQQQWTSLSFNVCHRGCLLAPNEQQPTDSVGQPERNCSSEPNDYCSTQANNQLSTTVVSLGAQLLSSEGHLIGSKLLVQLESNQTTLGACTRVEFAIDRGASKPLAWRPANGNQHHFAPLLIAKFELTLANTTRAAVQPLDLFELRVGLRPANNLTTGNFSGQELLLQGFGMHQEQAFSGRTMGLAAIMKDIYLLKSIGANLVRTSHYPYSSDYLDACDENGIMVIAECSAVGLNSFSELKLTLHKQMLREMMERDHHHPAIIMWSLANEPQSQRAEAEQYFGSLVQFARTELAQFTVLANRPLAAAIAQSHRDDRIGGLLDVIMVNRYFGWYDYLGVIEAIRLPLLESLSGWARKHPEKALLLSEFGADSLAGLHSSTRLLFSEEYQRDLLVEYERVIDELYAAKAMAAENTSGGSNNNKTSLLLPNGKPINFIGSMIWNFADFSTHDSLFRVGANRKGIFTRERQPKLAAQAISEIYLNRAKLLAEESNFSAILCDILDSSRQAAPAGSAAVAAASSSSSSCNQNILY